MFSLLLTTLLAASLGPMGPDAPAHEPQLAANGSIVGLTFGAGKRIYFSASHDSGKTFSTPVKVAEAEIVPLTRHRGPRIAFAGSTILISAVGGRTPRKSNTPTACPPTEIYSSGARSTVARLGPRER